MISVKLHSSFNWISYLLHLKSGLRSRLNIIYWIHFSNFRLLSFFKHSNVFSSSLLIWNVFQLFPISKLKLLLNNLYSPSIFMRYTFACSRNFSPRRHLHMDFSIESNPSSLTNQVFYLHKIIFFKFEIRHGVIFQISNKFLNWFIILS